LKYHRSSVREKLIASSLFPILYFYQKNNFAQLPNLNEANFPTLERDQKILQKVAKKK
jgi:hypothetical protein